MSETRDEYLDRLKMKLKALVPSDQWKSSMVDAIHSESLLLQADLESPARLNAPVSPSAARVGEAWKIESEIRTHIGFAEGVLLGLKETAGENANEAIGMAITKLESASKRLASLRAGMGEGE